MTIRDLFNIILKILGIFFIKDILVIIPQLFSVVFLISKPNMSDAVYTLAFTVSMLVIYVFTSFYLIFKTNFIIDKLKLDKGFDQDSISLNINRSAILSIAIIVIGGLLVANEIPNLCEQIFIYFRERIMFSGEVAPRISYSVLSAVKIIVGLLLIIKQRQIVNAIERKQSA